MSDKSRKGTTTRRPAADATGPQSNNPGAAGVLSQRPASPSRRASSRGPVLYWIGGALAILVVLYLGALFLVPSVLPNWMNPVPIYNNISPDGTRLAGTTGN